MDLLKSFIIGSSVPATFLHSASVIANDPKKLGNYPYHNYAFILPMYFGTINTIREYIAKKYNYSLETSLFVTSVLSVILVVNASYFLSSKYYEPYKSFDNYDWMYYVINNGGRHIIVLNLIIYYLEKFFYKSEMLRVFLICGGFLMNAVSFYKVKKLDQQGLINYDFKLYTITNPLLLGLNAVILLLIIPKLFKISLKTILILFVLFNPLIWAGLVKLFNTYSYSDEELKSRIIRNYTLTVPFRLLMFYLALNFTKMSYNDIRLFILIWIVFNIFRLQFY